MTIDMGDGGLGSVQRGRVRQGPSIADVAKLAGVAPVTVSRVSMGATNVRESTRRRVVKAMSDLGYSPNAAARALRYGSFHTFGIITHQFDRTGEARTVEGVIHAARDEGYNVSLIDVANPGSQDVDAAVRTLSSQAIDGLIIVRAEDATPETLALPPLMPVAVSDSRFVGHHPAVSADQLGGIAEAMRHLLGLGHRTVHHVAGPAESTPAQARLAAWQASLLAAGRIVPDVVRGDWTAESGYQAGMVLANNPNVTAILCANDEMAAGVLRALHEGGRRVPEEVSIVGFDDVSLAAFTWPPLTTIRQDFRAIGDHLVKLLMAQIREGKSLENVQILVPTQLIIRNSTANPPSL